MRNSVTSTCFGLSINNALRYLLNAYEEARHESKNMLRLSIQKMHPQKCLYAGSVFAHPMLCLVF